MCPTQLINPVSAIPKPADRCCDSAPYFRARLEGFPGGRQVLASTDVCATHLGDAVRNLTTWAQQANVCGQVIVLAIGAPDPGRQPGIPDPGARQMPSGFAFSVIPIDPRTTNTAPGFRRMPIAGPAPAGEGASPAAPGARALVRPG